MVPSASAWPHHRLHGEEVPAEQAELHAAVAFRVPYKFVGPAVLYKETKFRVDANPPSRWEREGDTAELEGLLDEQHMQQLAEYLRHPSRDLVQL